MHTLEKFGLMIMALGVAFVVFVTETGFDGWWWTGVAILGIGSAMLGRGQTLRHRAIIKRIEELSAQHERASKEITAEINRRML